MAYSSPFSDVELIRVIPPTAATDDSRSGSLTEDYPSNMSLDRTSSESIDNVTYAQIP